MNKIFSGLDQDSFESKVGPYLPPWHPANGSKEEPNNLEVTWGEARLIKPRIRDFYTRDEEADYNPRPEYNRMYLEVKMLTINETFLVEDMHWQTPGAWPTLQVVGYSGSMCPLPGGD